VQHSVVSAFPNVPQLGSMFAPNLEELQRLKPDLIICADWQAGLVPMFERIAPTHVFNLRKPQSSILNNATNLILDVGTLTGRPAQGAAYIKKAEETFDGLRLKIKNISAPAVIVGTLEPDGRHVTIFGGNSLFDSVFKHIGIRNLWRGSTNEWGNTRHGIEVLAEYPDATFLYLDTGPSAATALRQLEASTLWRSMPIVQRDRVVPIPFSWPFGGIPTALEFAESLAVTLQSMKSGYDGL
jgi:iron complex transport system substrate-binding protein